MKGKHGVSMQGIEYAPKKKGNVKCCECKHLIFKVTGKNKGTRADMCNHYCEIKKQARYYTSRCYCRQYEPQAEAVQTTSEKVVSILQRRAEQTQTEKINKRMNKRRRKKES